MIKKQEELFVETWFIFFWVIDFSFNKIFFLSIFMKFMSIFQRFYFFLSHIDFLSLIAWRSVNPLASKILRLRTERVNFLDYLDCSKVFQEFSSFEKALIGISKLSISVVPIEFVIFSVKIRFLNFKILSEKFKYLNFFKCYEFFSKCLHFQEVGVFITKNKMFVQFFLQSLWCTLEGEVFKSVQEFYQIFYW